MADSDPNPSPLNFQLSQLIAFQQIDHFLDLLVLCGGDPVRSLVPAKDPGSTIGVPRSFDLRAFFRLT